MYDNDNSGGYIRKGPGTKAPRHYESSRYCILKTTMLLRDGYELFLTSNGVVLIYDDIPCRYFEIVNEFPYLGYHFASRTSGHSLPPEIRGWSLATQHDSQEKSTRNTCHQARYPSTWKMTRLLSSEFPIHLFQKEEQQLGNSWAKKSLRGICSCSTTFQMTEGHPEGL